MRKDRGQSLTQVSGKNLLLAGPVGSPSVESDFSGRRQTGLDLFPALVFRIPLQAGAGTGCADFCQTEAAGGIGPMQEQGARRRTAVIPESGLHLPVHPAEAGRTGSAQHTGLVSGKLLRCFSTVSRP